LGAATPLLSRKLDFVRKKANLKSFEKRHVRRLSGFACATFFAMLEARYERFGVELRVVNPACTGVISKRWFIPIVISGRMPRGNLFR